MKVLIYNGVASAINGPKNTYTILKNAGMDVDYTNDPNSGKSLIPPTYGNLKKYDHFNIPGGDGGNKYLKVLAPYSAGIRQYVKEGGSVSGICAGAYYLSKSVWNIDKDGNKINKVYDGIGVGTIECKGLDDSEDAINILMVRPECLQLGKSGGVQKMAHYNGPGFLSPEGSSVIIFAIYNDPKVTDNYMYGAIAGDTHGKGRVILGGPHPELTPQDPDLLVSMVKWAVGSGNMDGVCIDKENVRIQKADFKAMITAVENYKGTPSKVYLRVSLVKTNQYFTKAKYDEIKKRWDAFKKGFSREPNYIDSKPVAENNSDYVRIPPFNYFFQQNDYICGPTSWLIVCSTYDMYMLGSEQADLNDPYSAEMVIAKVAGTSMSYAGTGHAGMLKVTPWLNSKFGKKLKSEFISFAGTGLQGIANYIRAGKRAIVNIMTGDQGLSAALFSGVNNISAHTFKTNFGWNFPGYSGSFGHYIVIVGVNVKNQTVTIADPDRNVKTVSYTDMKIATSLISSPSLMIIGE
ncbi:MAG: hypothetical protein AMQ22_00056 [Candidatus Methanofastidiosum methylothiophilum]|uniref:Peptidase C39-like domain-containing protein n=1 Tax=Candidatus Methanofastidiosum methylothiophilum TaxID=1705564 RepID=A0A150J9E5_9EURY|nr:MAG: hypothetical protein AMQ22_00056 [Candidatus Methanofastidiosum methylthiophilus]